MFALRTLRTQSTQSPFQTVLSVALRWNSTTSKPSQVASSLLNRPPTRAASGIISSKDLEQPKDLASKIPITGPAAGRMVRVDNGDIAFAFRNLRSVLNANNVRFDKMSQRFYKKPGKVLEEKRIRRKKKLFDEGIRRLMNIVKDAKRRGY